MSAVFKQLIENIESLSFEERALAAHCLISSLETKCDDDIESSWVKLSERRLTELEKGSIVGVSWDEIKSNLKKTDV